MKKSEVLHEGYTKGLKKAQQIINKMILESYDKEFDAWYDENVDINLAKTVGNGDPEIGRCVIQELWEMGLISGHEDNIDWVRYIDFKTNEELAEEWDLSSAGIDMNLAADNERIEEFFEDMGIKACEVQYTDSNGNFGYGWILLK